MKTTQNLNLKIPEGGDLIDISDITDNFETLDDEISKKSNSTGGDVSQTVVKTLETIDTQFPIPNAGESTKMFLGKVKKFIEDSNDAINRLDHVTVVTLTAADWAGSTPLYSQTVTVAGATKDSEAIVLSALEDGATETAQKAYSKAFGIVVSGTAELGDGTATFRVYKKPITDIKIGLKGV